MFCVTTLVITFLNLKLSTPETLVCHKIGERIYIVGFHPSLGIKDFSYPKPSEQKVCFADIKERKVPNTRLLFVHPIPEYFNCAQGTSRTKGNGFGYEIIDDQGVANAIVVGGMGRSVIWFMTTVLRTLRPPLRLKAKLIGKASAK